MPINIGSLINYSKVKERPMRSAVRLLRPFARRYMNDQFQTLPNRVCTSQNVGSCRPKILCPFVRCLKTRFPKAPCKRTQYCSLAHNPQHCWMLITCCVHLHTRCMLLCVVGSYCVSVSNDVQTNATTPNNTHQHATG